MLRCQCNMFHPCFRPIGELTVLHCMARRQCQRLLVKEQLRMCSLYGLDTPHGF
uniref:Uncharacterized protein n=1 Tax=Schistosoma japonicum TaxID=6182 RepID=Q5C376_SCHJA|nr:unknown [Schistosoma japonicum]